MYGVLLAPSLLQAMGCLTVMLESARWLMRKGDTSQAVNALYDARGAHYGLSETFEEAQRLEREVLIAPHSPHSLEAGTPPVTSPPSTDEPAFAPSRKPFVNFFSAVRDKYIRRSVWLSLGIVFYREVNAHALFVFAAHSFMTPESMQEAGFFLIPWAASIGARFVLPCDNADPCQKPAAFSPSLVACMLSSAPIGLGAGNFC